MQNQFVFSVGTAGFYSNNHAIDSPSFDCCADNFIFKLCQTGVASPLADYSLDARLISNKRDGFITDFSKSLFHSLVQSTT